jgi:hypothetical protein
MLMLRAVPAVVALLAASGSLTAEPEPGFSAILDVCEATSLEQAAIRGGALDWPAAPDDRDWRTSYERHNGGTVRVIGWRRGEREGDGLLAYWVATGPNAHLACSFSTDHAGLLEALCDLFGAPDTFEEEGATVSALWRRGGREVSFTRVGVNSLLSLTSRS